MLHSPDVATPCANAGEVPEAVTRRFAVRRRLTACRWAAAAARDKGRRVAKRTRAAASGFGMGVREDGPRIAFDLWRPGRGQEACAPRPNGCLPALPGKAVFSASGLR